LLLWKQTLGGSVFETGTGESRVVTLADGSTLQLGPQSHARVLFSARQRDVSLGRGEAVFKVAKDPARPFTVLADRARVRAVGTEFGVERRGDAVVVTVAEGRVAVSASASPVTFPFMKDSPPLSPIALDADEQVAIPHVGRTGPVRRVDSASSLAWVHGRLVFNDDVISLVVERFNQYNHVRLVLRDPTIASRRISGSFDATDPESFLAFLHSSIPGTVVHRRHEGEIEIGTASGP
jgi:transmembrane sensor